MRCPRDLLRRRHRADPRLHLRDHGVPPSNGADERRRGPQPRRGCRLRRVGQRPQYPMREPELRAHLITSPRRLAGLWARWRRREPLQYARYSGGSAPNPRPQIRSESPRRGYEMCSSRTGVAGQQLPQRQDPRHQPMLRHRHAQVRLDPDGRGPPGGFGLDLLRGRALRDASVRLGSNWTFSLDEAAPRELRHRSRSRCRQARRGLRCTREGVQGVCVHGGEPPRTGHGRAHGGRVPRGIGRRRSG